VIAQRQTPELDPRVDLRRENPDDREFLARLYASTRWAELTNSGWSDERKIAFLQQQFAAQTLHYDRFYADAVRSIVTSRHRPIGCLYLLQMAGDLRIVDISLLPEFRGFGIGGALMRRVFLQAEQTGSKVSIHVESFNPARRLYARLGFAEKSSDDVYILMERAPCVS
jgi:GNAT superfamily N-acetyltransferase